MHYTLEKPITRAELEARKNNGHSANQQVEDSAAAVRAPRPRARRRTKPVRLCDVARAAGVSTATVSMVVNNNPRISPATQRRVRRAVERLGYQPSHAAQVLSGKRGNVISILMPAQRADISDSYFASLSSGIAEQAASIGYSVMFTRATAEFVRNRNHVSMIEQQSAQGLLLLGFNDFDRFVDDIDAARHPVVVVDNQLDGRSDLDFVGCDYASGAEQALNYLLQLGHRKIGLITSSAGGRNASEIVEAYRSMMSEHGIRPGEGWIADGQSTEEGGAEAAEMILRRHPEVTALFAASDAMAIGAIHEAAKRGLRVPRDLSIIGFDNVRHSAYLTPALTTVQLPLAAVGAKACERLIERINGRAEAMSDRLPAHLVLRNSAAMAKDVGVGTNAA